MESVVGGLHPRYGLSVSLASLIDPFPAFSRIISINVNMNHYTFGTLPDGRSVKAFLLENALGMRVRVMEYGATLTHFSVPDQDGKPVDIVLGFDTLEGYLGDHPYFGATVGRFANRIAGGQFSIDGNTYQVTQNEGNNILHGGSIGFDKQLWQGEKTHTSEGQSVTFRLTSPDGQEGFPGTLEVSVSYTLRVNGSLAIRYAATTDQPTVVNLTNHAYFNLDGRGSVRDTWLQMSGKHFTPGDDAGIPIGTVKEVFGEYDFRTPKQIGKEIDSAELANRNGYDHNYVVDGPAGTLREAARAWSDRSGIELLTLTTEPCIQLYTGNWLSETGEKRGGTVAKNGAFCLETQHAPDAPNHPAFDSPILRPGEIFQSETIYAVSLREE